MLLQVPDINISTAGQDFNFKKVNTLNQETPYDYSSVMHYGRSV